MVEKLQAEIDKMEAEMQSNYSETPSQKSKSRA